MKMELGYLSLDYLTEYFTRDLGYISYERYQDINTYPNLGTLCVF